MLKTYFKISLRNLLKNKLFSSITIAGLAIGMACSILILRWVQDELSYDKFFRNSDSIYRINWEYKWNGEEGIAPITPPPLAAKFVSEIPEVTATTRIFPVQPMVVRYNDKFFNEDKIFGADSNFFDIFNFKLLSGNPGTALTEPNSVILTEKIAKKYFGNESAIGKIIIIGDQNWEINKLYKNTFKVTGVLENIPANTHLQFDLLTSISSYPKVVFFDWSWIWMQEVTYAKLKPAASVPLVEAKVKQVVAKYAPAAFTRIGFSYNDIVNNGGRYDFVFQPLKDIYLGSTQIGNRLGPIGNRTYVYAFSLIAAFIIFIACINFMNLSTARSEKRAREVGIRKTLGSSQKALFIQFILESIIYSLLGLFLSLILVELLIFPFNNLTGKSLSFNLFSSYWQIPVLILLGMFVGLVAGSYPGLFLSSLQPVKVLKGAVKFHSRGGRFRNILVIFQFAVGIALMVCTITVRQQMSFINNTNLGFNKANVVIISNQNNPLGNHLDAFKEKLKSYSQVIDASVTTGVPPNSGFGDYYKISGKGDEQFSFISYMTDEDFLNTLNIKLVQGRGFLRDHPIDAQSVILNETAVKQFNIKDPLGKIINYPSKGNYTIIGIIKDFNFLDLHQPILPFALFSQSSGSYQIPNSYIIVRLKNDHLAKSISLLESTWKSFVDKTPFKYSFLNENLEQQYTSELKLGKIFFIFSILAIFIACIGLLGLAFYSVEQRTKEIGIRKVLGSSITGIVVLLTREFTKWLIIANIIAWPVSYYLMNKWLDGFAYKMNMSIGIFLSAGLISLFIASLTVSYQAVKAAAANPVKSLKYE
ncbi:MAG: ABC transporter permease [Ignavibacteriaceae bacterium]